MSRPRVLVTPEGIELPVDLAGGFERGAAFALDALLIGIAAAVWAFVPLYFGSSILDGELAITLVLIGEFLITQLGFALLEVRGQGTSPGKRRFGLRVVDRHGGRLTATALFTRNLLRVVELELPLLTLLAPSRFTGGDLPGWLELALSAWLAGLLLFPFLNRDRLRLGDLFAGTLVVRVPKIVLLPDLAIHGPREARGAAAQYAFTPAQLSIYGAYELQVLEQLLRTERSDRSAAIAAVAERVAAKIGWPAEERFEPFAFVAAFYAAQRAHLEKELLLGRRKEAKSA